MPNIGIQVTKHVGENENVLEIMVVGDEFAQAVRMKADRHHEVTASQLTAALRVIIGAVKDRFGEEGS